MTLPTIHLNGTSREELIAQLQTASDSLHEAIARLAGMAPNGRDYYPQGPDVYAKARREHEDRIHRLMAIRAEVCAIWEAIS